MNCWIAIAGSQLLSLGISVKKIIKHLSEFNDFPVISAMTQISRLAVSNIKYKLSSIKYVYYTYVCLCVYVLVSCTAQTVAHINIYHAVQFPVALPLKCIYLFALRLLLHWTAFYCIVPLLLLLLICYFSCNTYRQRLTEYEIVLLLLLLL